MDDRQKMEPGVKEVLRILSYGHLIEEMYDTVREHQNAFLSMGITLYDLKELLELKSKVSLLPDALSYSLERPGRGDYLLENFDNPSVQLTDNNESRFVAALRVFYQQQAEYQQKMESLSKTAKKHLESVDRSFYRFGEDDELKLLVDILLNRDIDTYINPSNGEQRHFLEKFDLYDAYHINDNRITLRWKAGGVLESKGFLDKGSTERELEKAGASVDRLRDNLSRHKIDKLRIGNVEILSDDEGDKYIHCHVDGGYEDSRKLSAKDVLLLNRLGNRTGIAVRYYADILEKNRKENLAIADEKTLSRLSMPYAERLVDIHRHGMNEQDVMLSEASKDVEIDSFWSDNMIEELEKYPVEKQKDYAFGCLMEHLCGLDPGMLTDEEIISLVGTEGFYGDVGRKIEHNLMELTESLFPVIEKSGEFDRDVIDYVKVQRGIGRTTPTMAYNSMCYFLSLRLQTEWDPIGADDEYGQVTGCYYYPNKSISNPAEKFPPNLMSEKQWNMLIERYRGCNSFIPNDAFRMNRITKVQIYPLRNGELNIRCMVDGEQQSGKQLSEVDAKRCTDEKTNKRELAVGYFMDAFAREPEREMALVR